MAVFFLKLETGFAEQYEAFFAAIEDRKPLADIIAARQGIVQSLRDGFVQLFKVQGLVTILLVAFAETLGSRLGLGSVKVGIFQVTLFGTFLLIGFLSLLTVLFYVDDRRGALLCTASFAVANAALSLPTIKSNEAWFGFGFVVAAGLGMALAAWRVNRRVAELESAIFRAQG
jgi:polysaccharide biosynthesis protein PelG